MGSVGATPALRCIVQPMKPQHVLSFWFGGAGDAVTTAARQAGLWWGGDAATDAEIRRRFGAAHIAAAAGELDHWTATPSGRLALIIVLDQLSRNIHRGQAAAFAQDGKALQLAQTAIVAGEDRKLAPIRRVFCYLPLEHAEDLAAQRLCVEKFTVLRDGASRTAQKTFAFYLDYAWQHYDIIARFGRFPHRNAILSRTSTPEETAWLQTSNTHFGQG